MPKIKILPEILSNKIAAGEVVERPASVVKELVENAIDAEATRIFIEIEKGGRSLIRISDNGIGMHRDDAMLSIERYATSKIHKDPDLFSIRTLGFRGEAIPSICSVSKFTMITRPKDTDSGTKIHIEGGRIKNVSETGAPEGTMITVRNLFYNTPARRKFLKTINTEMGHIADTISGMALAHPGIQFKLTHNNKVIKHWSVAHHPKDRAGDVLGRSLEKSIVDVSHEAGTLSISGWVGLPSVSRATTRGIYLFVNGRWVRDRMVQHALFSGFSGRLMKGRHPIAVLFIKIPHDQVDVNVHPTKHEIRFLEQQKVHGAIKTAVKSALNASEFHHISTGPSRPSSVPFTKSYDRVNNPAPTAHTIRQRIDFNKLGSSVAPKDAGSHSHRAESSQAKAFGNINGTETGPPISKNDESKAFSPKKSQSLLWKKQFFSDLVVIGQYHGTYIICESDEGLILIDQHAAHERIVFEALKAKTKDKTPSSQMLLLPETIELNYSETQIMEKLIPGLNQYGLAIEGFGHNTFVVKAVPVLLDSRNIPALITELVEKSAQIGINSGMETIMDECLMIMACHNALRANKQLTQRQITAMLEQLDRCETPSHCPHGRPTWIKWSLKDLEKMFKRS